MKSRNVKKNLTFKVVAICVTIIAVIVYLLMKGHHSEQLNFKVWEMFTKHRYFAMYVLAINGITFFVYGIDKLCAIKDWSRVPIVTLLGLAFAGGSLGGLVAMYTFHHKTKKAYFTVGVPLIIVMQLVVMFFVMNSGTGDRFVSHFFLLS